MTVCGKYKVEVLISILISMMKLNVMVAGFGSIHPCKLMHTMLGKAIHRKKLILGFSPKKMVHYTRTKINIG